MIGRRIGPYEVTDKLGEGAMGEVYRATDTRLKRGVALKMLSRRFASDSDRVARLRREAEVLASLSHAHIGQIYGLESVDESLVLVLELVEGPTLDERLAKGALPWEEALRIAQQIAAALETAHEAGIIHRDLKPENVKLTPGGDVKVLDFGLAKGVQVLGGGTDLTADGAVIGTPAYMSPEQIEGNTVDRRADIWAFGCLLFEMLAGRKAFAEDSVGSLFAAITTRTIDRERLREIPAPVRRLVERCLRRNPRTRLRDVGDARIEIEDLLAGNLEPLAPDPAPAPVRTSSVKTIAVVAVLAGAVTGWVLSTLMPSDPVGEPPRPARYSIALFSAPRTLQLDSKAGYSPPIEISADGRKVAFAALDRHGSRQLYLHSADDGRLVSIPEANGAEFPFFSTDARQIGYVYHGGDDLYVLNLADRAKLAVSKNTVIQGASWHPAGGIVYGHSDRGLRRIAATGGDSEELTVVGSEDADHRWPQVLPGGKHVLFTAVRKDRQLEARIFSFESRRVVPLGVYGALARYVRSPREDGTGFIVYLRTNDLWAVRIDTSTWRTLGDPVHVLGGVHVPALGNPHLAVAASGTLVYEPRRPPSPGRRLVWVDRNGNKTPLTEGKGYEFPRISPDGKMVAVAVHTEMATHDIWTVDAQTGTEVKRTSGGNYVEPLWSPDGEELAFADFWGGNLMRQRLSESSAQPLLRRNGRQYPIQWRNPDSFLFMETLADPSFDVGEVDPKTGTVRELLRTPDNECSGVVSPDGRWLACVSDETGRPEIYLRDYPGLGGKLPVSSDGGTEPVWSADSRELFFRRGWGFFVVRVPRSADETIGKPELLFEGTFVPGFINRSNYDVSSDGQRFVMVEGGWGLTMGRLDIHIHFDEELDALVPPVEDSRR